jgi:hypothetical protein
VKILPVALEIDDRIANELAGTVKSHISAALDLEQLHALALQKVRRSNQMLLLRRSSECDYRGMLYEKEDVLREGARDTITGDLTLELERFRVRHSPQRNRP